ncbi:coiled-coil domain-containing protein 12 [Anopheles nili]|uniref:coiled-coil domain-containing protein 12 n=1 Tax=Anopheles nili TaxID=185578 RepID=UPI00237B819D|nr:coiled-coil domain-containing protein 12 [Anopheles nili]
MADSIGKLEEEARKRKDRLRMLKEKQTTLEVQSLTSNPESDTIVKANIPKPIFRNYKPESEEIQMAVIENGRVGNVENEVSTQLEMMKTSIVIEEIDVANLAPRKPDWDLKRDVSKKLEKLERGTQKAIAELIRERLKAGQEQDILQVVNVGISKTSLREDDANRQD